MCHGIVFLLCPYEFATQKAANEKEKTKVNKSSQLLAQPVLVPDTLLSALPSWGSRRVTTVPNSCGFSAELSCDRLGTLWVALSFGKTYPTLNRSANKTLFSNFHWCFQFHGITLAVTEIYSEEPITSVCQSKLHSMCARLSSMTTECMYRCLIKFEVPGKNSGDENRFLRNISSLMILKIPTASILLQTNSFPCHYFLRSFGTPYTLLYVRLRKNLK